MVLDGQSHARRGTGALGVLTCEQSSDAVPTVLLLFSEYEAFVSVRDLKNKAALKGSTSVRMLFLRKSLSNGQSGPEPDKKLKIEQSDQEPDIAHIELKPFVSLHTSDLIISISVLKQRHACLDERLVNYH